MKSGNVLFLILLAVALFAALSYAVTQSSRSGGNDISDEDARLAASQIVQYGALMEQTVSRLRLINSCKGHQISFASDSDEDGNWYDTDDLYHNPNAPDDLSCHVFHPAGGGVKPIILPSTPTPLNIVYNGGNLLHLHGNPSCVNEACSELIISIWDVPDNICREINRRISGDSSIPEQDSGMHWELTPFNGTYIYGGWLAESEASYCFDRADADDTNFFYHVLIAR